VVTIGPFSRGGTNRTGQAACDHDFTTHKHMTPFGIFLPRFAELFLYMVCSRVTSDCVVDILLQWWKSVRDRFPHIQYLVINLDNGPENNSHRTQFMARMVQFAQETGLCITLAYYPPYHSKYNPIERCWGVLEKHWNGDILDTDATVMQFAKTMTWKGKHPTCVERISTVYETGVKLTKSAMQQIETQIERLSALKRWFVTIPATTVPASFGRF
jgi:hypothetical protein